MLSLASRQEINGVLKGESKGNPTESLLLTSTQKPNRRIVKEDFSDFTVDKWKNKIFTDPRVRSKLKDRNYRVKIIENVELTRAAVNKLLPKSLLVSLDGVIALGSDNVLFEAKIKEEVVQTRNTFQTTVPAIVKVWHKSGKQLMESKKPFYENDAEFMGKLSKFPNTDFRELWAEREMNILDRLTHAGVKCAKGITCIRNVLIMSPQSVTIAQQEANSDSLYRLNAFWNAVTTMKVLYTSAGLVHAGLSEKNITSDGTIYDVYRVVNKLSPDAYDFLYKTCNNLYKFIKPLELKRPDGLASMFFDITGNEYVPKKPVISKMDTVEKEVRQLERKSERSAKQFHK